MKKRINIKKLRSKYRFSIYNDQTYEEVWNMRLSRLNVMSFVGAVGLILIALTVSLMAFTPLREFIPGYPDSNTRKQILSNMLRLDSLQQEVRNWVLYNDNLSRILNGKDPIDLEGKSDTALAVRYREIVLQKSHADSLFRKDVEQMEFFSLNQNAERIPEEIENLHFFPPVRGKITRSFAPQFNNFGVYISAPSGSLVMAAYDGTIIAVNWTVDLGYIVQIQHDVNVITIYKNLGQCLKKTGVRVNAGEVIGVTNNLHGDDKDAASSFAFEVWSNGSPVNPERYIVF
jgi:murein DD-endopeptidase MepM/ murein hydrolase activator NlpD